MVDSPCSNILNGNFVLIALPEHIQDMEAWWNRIKIPPARRITRGAILADTKNARNFRYDRPCGSTSTKCKGLCLRCAKRLGYLW